MMTEDMMKENMTIIEENITNEEQKITAIPENVLGLGEVIYEEQSKDKNKFLTNIFKEIGVSENNGRIAYWFYVCIEKLGIKAKLTRDEKINLLNDFKPYIILNYVKILKNINFETADEDFKEYFYRFFLRTCLLREEEIKNEVDSLFSHLITSVTKLTKDNLYLIEEIAKLKSKKEKMLSKNADYKCFIEKLDYKEELNNTFYNGVLDALKTYKENSDLTHKIMENIFSIQKSLTYTVIVLFIANIMINILK